MLVGRRCEGVERNGKKLVSQKNILRINGGMIGLEENGARRAGSDPRVPRQGRASVHPNYAPPAFTHFFRGLRNFRGQV